MEPSPTHHLPGLVKIERAIVSVTDKNGLEILGPALVEHGVEIISSSGTARKLRELNVPVTEVSAFTGTPEMLGGRVKTLDPRVAAGVLFRRDNEADVLEMNEYKLEAIDLVVVNLYDFASASADEEAPIDQVIEEIDIGGPTLLREGAKNHLWVVVLSDPRQYADFVAEFERHDGRTSLGLRWRCAQLVFGKTANYDLQITQWMARQETPAG